MPPPCPETNSSSKIGPPSKKFVTRSSSSKQAARARKAQKWLTIRVWDKDTLAAAFYTVPFDIFEFLAECGDSNLDNALEAISVDGDVDGKDMGFDCDTLRKGSVLQKFLLKVLKHAKYFDLEDFIDDWYCEYDDAGRGAQRHFTYPKESTHILNLFSTNWTRVSRNPVKKWVQVMVFNADESESDASLAAEDHERAYGEEMHAAKKQRGAGSSRDA
jgi:hypothetical protein